MITPILRPVDGHIHYVCTVDHAAGVRVGLCGTAMRPTGAPRHAPPCVKCVNARPGHRDGCPDCRRFWPEHNPTSRMIEAMSRAGLL